MKKLLAITVVFQLSIQYAYSQNNSWQQVSDFAGISRLHAVAFTIGNYAYVGLGNDGNNFLQDFWRYDPSTNTWSPIADFLGSARDRSVAFSVNGKGYVGLGLDNSGFKNDFYEYDPTSNTWTQISNFPGTPRIGATAFATIDKGYVGSGSDVTSDRSDFYQFNPNSNSWVQIADFVGGNRRYASAFSINNVGYVGTGLNGSVDYSDFWKYDTLSNNWLAVSPIPGVARAGASSFSIGNFGYIGTGNSPTYLQDFWEYNALQNTWTQRPNFIGSARELGVGFSVNGCGFIGTGYSTINTKDIFKYIPICNNYDTTIFVQACDSFVFESQTIFSSGEYSTNYTTEFGCDSTINLSLTILPTPAISAGVDQTVCDGTSITLSGTGGSVYNWDNGVINGVSFNPPVGTSTYIVVGTSSNGCTNSDTVVLQVNALPVVSFIPDVTTGCIPLNVNLINSTPSSTNCVWTISDGTVLTGCGSVSNLFDQPGCYDVSLTTTDQNGCTNTFNAVNLICVEAPPTAAFTANSNSFSLQGQQITFTNSSTNATSYVWNFGDSSPLSTLVDPTHVYQIGIQDSFIVELIAFSTFGCSDTLSLTIYDTSMSDSIDTDIFIPTGFSPKNDSENDTWSVTGLEKYPNAIINVFNRWGQLLFEGGPGNSTWNGLYQGEILPTADYYYVVDLGNGTKFNGVITLKQ